MHEPRTNRWLPRAFFFSLVMFVAACGKTAPSKPTPEPFIYKYSLSPTPLDDASTRYTDFLIHMRKVGEEKFSTLAPSSNTPTQDNSVMVTFLVPVADVVSNAKYESYVSYKLDGQEQKTSMTPTVLRGSSY